MRGYKFWMRDGFKTGKEHRDMNNKASTSLGRTLAKFVLFFLTPLLVCQQALADETPRFITLGTMGGPLPHAERSQPSNALVVGDRVYLVDAGDGTSGQLAKAGIALAEVDVVFITHLHSDHVSGLGAVLMLRLGALTLDPIKIYGPPGTKNLVDGLLSAMQPLLETGYGQGNVAMPNPHEIFTVVEVDDGWKGLMDGMKVSTVRNTHFGSNPSSVSLAYRFDLMGGSIVFTGDTGPSPAVELLAQDADFLFAEMIDLDVTLNRIRRLNSNLSEQQFNGIAEHLAAQHLSPDQVGAMAARAHVSHVVVTHLVPGTVDEDRLTNYKDTIKSRFDGKVTIAEDLDVFELR